MKTSLCLIGVLSIALVLCGCGYGPQKQQGNLEKDLPHAVTPQNNQTYRIHNLQYPGKRVFLFSSAEAVAQCFKALEAGQDQETTCSPEIVATVPDQALVRALECHKSPYAVCEVQVMEGDEAGVKGALLWDWLAPVKRSQ